MCLSASKTKYFYSQIFNCLLTQKLNLNEHFVLVSKTIISHFYDSNHVNDRGFETVNVKQDISAEEFQWFQMSTNIINSVLRSELMHSILYISALFSGKCPMTNVSLTFQHVSNCLGKRCVVQMLGFLLCGLRSKLLWKLQPFHHPIFFKNS